MRLQDQACSSSATTRAHSCSIRARIPHPWMSWMVGLAVLGAAGRSYADATTPADTTPTTPPTASSPEPALLLPPPQVPSAPPEDGRIILQIVAGGGLGFIGLVGGFLLGDKIAPGNDGPSRTAALSALGAGATGMALGVWAIGTIGDRVRRSLRPSPAPWSEGSPSSRSTPPIHKVVASCPCSH